MILAEYKLSLKSEKYEFNKQQIEYLGLIISKDQVKMNLMKVARVCNWPTLQNCT